MGLRTGITALALALAPGPALPDIYALVIGIDDYAHIPKLRGAVNDALDLNDAITALPDAEVTLLLNAQATRERIFEVWERYAAEAGPGDTILVTFAGHGSGEPAAYPDTEEDGQDETLLLAGFQPQGPGAAARIRDDEIAALIAKSPDAHVVVVADACHSGTTTRASVFDMTYRFFENGEIADDPLPPPPPPSARVSDMGQGGNQTFFGAVGDSEKAPEFPIGGQVRGALSYAFAQGLRGAADHDGDGVVAKGELEVHVRRFIKQATAAKQRPKVAPAGQRDLPLFALTSAPRPPLPEAPFAREFDDLPLVSVRSGGQIDATTLLAGLSGVDVIAKGAEDEGTMIVNLKRRTLRSAQGDTLRRIFGRRQAGFRIQIQETVDKLRGIRAIQAAQLSETLDVWFPYGDELYAANDPVRMEIAGRTYPYVSVVNLPSDGTVEWIYPILPEYMPRAGIEDPERLSPGAPLALEVFVVPPFGSDHVLVIETPEPHDAVRRALSRHHLGTNFRAFWTDLHYALKDKPHSVAVHAFFSRRKINR